MTLFIAACALLILVSGLFYLFPKAREGGADADLERANLDWFRQREQELGDQESELQADVRLRLLEDEEGSASAVSGVSNGSFVSWMLLPLVALFSGGLYYALGAAPDVLISRQLRALNEESNAQDMESVMLAIEHRAGQRPQNLHYRAMLGRYYMGQQDYARATTAYGDLSQDAPQDAQALAYAAQADYLASGRELSERARMRAEQALAIDPHQRTALGLLGMASFEQGLFRAAIDYWQRLLAVETPGSESAMMISSVIASAQQKLGEDPAVAPEAAVIGAGVSVNVELPEGAEVAPGDTVFVLARNAASDSRMPIAVQRLPGSSFPINLRLDDSNSMAGQKLSQTESVLVIVQVSPNGQPGEANASWVGQAGPLAPSSDTAPVTIVLKPAR